MKLTRDLATQYSRVALGHVGREYPHKLDHVLTDDADARTPRALHPIFFGSFDWHSCVHGYWTLARVLRVFPDLDTAPEIIALFRERFTPENVAVECAYVARPASRGFERPYGWGWLLHLYAELSGHGLPFAEEIARNLRPLAELFADRFRAFLPICDYPVRTGTHGSTAFALRLAARYAAIHDEPLFHMMRDKVLAWHGADADAQSWEPSQDDFLSPTLMVAECMRRFSLDPPAFQSWLAAYLPRIAQREPATLFTPATVSDRTDGKIAHLDGLNLSRAWCWRGIAKALHEDDPARAVALQTADDHIASAMAHVAGDYMGEHWLASFALLALDD